MDGYETTTTFVCECENAFRLACEGEPFFGEQEGKRYCVLHFRGAGKRQAFDAAVERKLKATDFNYQGVWFPQGVWFNGLEIPNSANFTSATFDTALFNKTVFRGFAHFRFVTFTGDGAFRRAAFESVVFEGPVDFGHAIFNANGEFNHATFKERADFNEATFEETAGFRRAKFEADANFWECTFVKRVDFDEAVFSGHAIFWPTIFRSDAWFRAARFGSASFSGSTFGGEATFSWCEFGPVRFGAAFTKKADFFSARFRDVASFSGAEFEQKTEFRLSLFVGEAFFGSATFSGETDFSYVTFKDSVTFSAEHGSGGFVRGASCDFRHARFERADLVSFHTLELRPYWFLNVDPRRFDFVAVRWPEMHGRNLIKSEIGELIQRAEKEKEEESKRKAQRRRNAERFGDERDLEELEKEEAKAAQHNGSSLGQKRASFHHLLSITCRQLAVNAEDSHRYDEASDFRFWSMELRRREGLRARGRLDIAFLHFLYRYLSGYGERIALALAWLLAIWLMSAFLYTHVGFVNTSPLSTADQETYVFDGVGAPIKQFNDALAYSLAVMTLQKPEPRPLTAAAKFVVLAETIVGPIQAALLLLAVRRRFMR